MSLKSILNQTVSKGEFTIYDARKLLEHDWKTLIKTLPIEIKREAETFFYFVEGFVEEVDEGFVDERSDSELAERAIALLSKL